MRFLFESAKLFDLNLGLFCTFSLPELNEIKFTMKLGKEYADVQELPWLIAAF
jgi:hypothetical protein